MLFFSDESVVIRVWSRKGGFVSLGVRVMSEFRIGLDTV